MFFLKNCFSKIIPQSSQAARKAAQRERSREAQSASGRETLAGGAYGLLAGGERQAYRGY